MIATLSPAHIAYLGTQRLGRLATIRPDGTPQNNPVGFRYNEALGTIDIAGHNLGASQKFRNLAKHEHVAFVVDDIASTDPWEVRCLEIRGTAQALREVETFAAGASPELIRITPERVLAFGI
ncbi:PPOX class F420-dependent oxidoreductase [Nocardia terpenica]|uniref:Pyridoxamine 5'-phosphate oxidase n=1 Tax=Nocardia terpenica TaxID=455432 RepID=A0A164KHS9_9NOCA|nr:PPOX class F420-dependent oxidoreductase [Nocardia terpenica]KZM71404.1 pyridoxamine 5'-phosphate oxidase [Nocardia terpenica]MBF6060835.1 PPOX class F420-dependent oxidoreductase [Nocardia terpenica]MBF6104095.1 PPOX class F420-dependent oxidoreductase [Nocardia terpenica]MBF6111531.1 PPOX class F420-dependent oxidoreductase [Nocardia terpenica]MBF6118316.1 PPOX class F420-dependent oxidoreductase [Nocardia terpenica]